MVARRSRGHEGARDLSLGHRLCGGDRGAGREQRDRPRTGTHVRVGVDRPTARGVHPLMGGDQPLLVHAEQLLPLDLPGLDRLTPVQKAALAQALGHRSQA